MKEIASRIEDGGHMFLLNVYIFSVVHTTLYEPE
jgi:hypothetical protein